MIQKSSYSSPTLPLNIPSSNITTALNSPTNQQNSLPISPFARASYISPTSASISPMQSPSIASPTNYYSSTGSHNYGIITGSPKISNNSNQANTGVFNAGFINYNNVYANNYGNNINKATNNNNYGFSN